jgi:hypothetical protein
LHQANPRDVASDSRDVMQSQSRDGRHWTRRTRVNDGASHFDNAFPEAAVDRGGEVHLVWYDHRGDAAGIFTDLIHTRSRDGGGGFTPNERVNDGPGHQLKPGAEPAGAQQGRLHRARRERVYAMWSDGRLGTPDSWVVPVGRERHAGG